MSEEHFVRLVLAAEACENRRIDREEEEEEEERVKQSRTNVNEEDCLEEAAPRRRNLPNRTLKKPNLKLIVDPALHELLTKPR